MTKAEAVQYLRDRNFRAQIHREDEMSSTVPMIVAIGLYIDNGIVTKTTLDGHTYEL